MDRENRSGIFSAYVFYDDEKTKLITCPDSPDTMIDHNGFQIRLRDVCLIGEGFVTHTDVKLQGETDFQKLFVWKAPHGNGIMYLPTDPRLPDPPMVIRGVEITAEQDKSLNDGGYIFLEGMDTKDGSGKFSSHVFMDDERKRLFFNKNDPNEFVKYGVYEMRLRDKRQVEKGLTTRAVIRLSGSELAGARLWKENPEDAGYNVPWDDSRVAKEQREQANKEREQSASSFGPLKQHEQKKQAQDIPCLRPRSRRKGRRSVRESAPAESFTRKKFWTTIIRWCEDIYFMLIPQKNSSRETPYYLHSLDRVDMVIFAIPAQSGWHLYRCPYRQYPEMCLCLP